MDLDPGRLGMTCTTPPGRRAVLLGLAFALLAGCRSPAETPSELPRGTQVGERAPRLDGWLAGGEPFVLEETDGGDAVVVFYRSAHCGLCRLQLEQLQQHHAAYQRQGARVLAVTLDEPELNRALADEMQLTFSIVSADSSTFGSWEALNPEHSVAMPATYIVDRTGTVRFRHVGRNAADRTSDAELLTVLERLRR